jgi:hypothetical protein
MISLNRHTSHILRKILPIIRQPTRPRPLTRLTLTMSRMRQRPIAATIAATTKQLVVMKELSSLRMKLPTLTRRRLPLMRKIRPKSQLHRLHPHPSPLLHRSSHQTSLPLKNLRLRIRQVLTTQIKPKTSHIAI